MNRKKLMKTAWILTLATLIPISGFAANYGQGKQRRPQGPPKEAIAVCKGKSSGDAVSFTGRHGESLDATCEERDGQLVAVPKNAPRDNGGSEQHRE